jgi:hypothetical protein
MAIFKGGNVQLVKPGDELYFDKPVEINEHGNNAAIKVHILDDATMGLNGFKWIPEDRFSGHWYFCNPVYEDITFNFTIYSEDDWQIDILDEYFLQPYDYQYLLEKYSNDINTRVLEIVKKNVDEIMDSFVHKGIISGWEVGDYI